jgi:hypothetical protein
MAQKVSGARGLFYLKIAELVWFVITTLFWMVMWRSSFGVHDYQTFLSASRVIWILVAVANPVLLWIFFQGRRGTPTQSLAYGALILSVMLLVFDLAFEFLHVRSFEAWNEPILIARMAMFFITDIFVWLAVVRTLPQDPGLSTAYFAVLAASAVLSLLTSLRLLPSSMMMESLSWLSRALSLVGQLLVIVVLRRLARDGALGPGDLVDADAAVSVAPPPRAGGRDIAIGLAFLVGGCVITFASYSAASSAGGGQYFVTTGAIAYGLVKLIRGLVAVSSSEPPRR